MTSTADGSDDGTPAGFSVSTALPSVPLNEPAPVATDRATVALRTAPKGTTGATQEKLHVDLDALAFNSAPTAVAGVAGTAATVTKHSSHEQPTPQSSNIGLETPRLGDAKRRGAANAGADGLLGAEAASAQIGERGGGGELVSGGEADSPRPSSGQGGQDTAVHDKPAAVADAAVAIAPDAAAETRQLPVQAVGGVAARLLQLAYVDGPVLAALTE